MVANTARGITAHPGAIRKKGFPTCWPGLLASKGGLAEVVQQQRREHQGVPGQLDRPTTEVTHVGVQRFAPRDDEEDRPEGQERLGGLVHEERHGVRR
jgi:hypothetical protein